MKNRLTVSTGLMKGFYKVYTGFVQGLDGAGIGFYIGFRVVGFGVVKQTLSSLIVHSAVSGASGYESLPCLPAEDVAPRSLLESSRSVTLACA